MIDAAQVAMKALTLSGTQQHLLRLIAKDADVNGWAPVSSVLMDLIRPVLPEELATIEETGDSGRGRASLTLEGKSVVDMLSVLEGVK